MSSKRIHHKQWHTLSGSKILDVVKTSVEPITVLPDERILNDLKVLESATLEVLEDRTLSTVYRIRETGRVHHMFTDGRLNVYMNYDHYLSQKPVDSLLIVFPAKDLVFRIFNELGEDVIHEGIERLKKPRFTAYYMITDGVITFHNIIWLDKPEGEVEKNSALKKAILFIKFNVGRSH